MLRFLYQYILFHFMNTHVAVPRHHAIASVSRTK